MKNKDRIDVALKKAPLNYRKLIRLGTMGATVPYYLCGAWLRGTDLQGKDRRGPRGSVHMPEGARNLMLKYRGAGLIKAGFIGAVLIVLVIVVGPIARPAGWRLATSVKYQALFSEAGGLAPGNPVTVSGNQGRCRVGCRAAQTAMLWSHSR